MKNCAHCGNPTNNNRRKYCSPRCRWWFNSIKRENEKHLPPVRKRTAQYFYMITGRQPIKRRGAGRRYGSMIQGSMAAQVWETIEELVEVNEANLQRHFFGNAFSVYQARLGDGSRMSVDDFKDLYMKKKVPIRNRNTNAPTLYYAGGEMTDIPNIGEVPIVLLHVKDDTVADVFDIEARFTLAAITADFVYYLDENEYDDTANVVMLNREMNLVSDNYFGANDLTCLVATNEGLLWISDTVKYWQREQFVKPEQITPEIKGMLNEVDVEKLTDKENIIYLSYMNGPVQYSKPEALMAVISNDLDQDNYSDQLAAIMEKLEANDD